ncbi:MAG: clan AA aspartic protease [Anaerolineales bacterium]|nr:clan AA aspartic protease [Anaerolineales bacterium]
MQLELIDDLPYTILTVNYQSNEIEIEYVLVDTGSASTIFSSDYMARIGISPLPKDTLHTIRGVGGIETVFNREVDHIQLGSKKIEDVVIEVGGMDYGFDINGILGMDVLLSVGAIINLHDKRIDFA